MILTNLHFHEMFQVTLDHLQILKSVVERITSVSPFITIAWDNTSNSLYCRFHHLKMIQCWLKHATKI